MTTKLHHRLRGCMFLVNIFILLLGVLMFAFALYLYFANWGNLDPGFFIGTGTIVLLFGTTLCASSTVGCAANKDDETKGCCGGRNMNWYFHIILIIALACEIVLLVNSFQAVSQYGDTLDLLRKANEKVIPYASQEITLKEKFDKFFFGAASSCKATLYLWFWDWVNNNCPETVHQSNCQGCYDYSIRLCQADYNSCNGGNGIDLDHSKCPYDICREGILSYFITRAKSFAIAALVFALLQFIIVLVNLATLCYNPRHSQKQLDYHKSPSYHDEYIVDDAADDYETRYTQENRQSQPPPQQSNPQPQYSQNSRDETRDRKHGKKHRHHNNRHDHRSAARQTDYTFGSQPQQHQQQQPYHQQQYNQRDVWQEDFQDDDDYYL